MIANQRKRGETSSSDGVKMDRGDSRRDGGADRLNGRDVMITKLKLKDNLMDTRND